MILGTYMEDKGFDSGVLEIIKLIKQGLASNDDYFLMCVGPTGTGKSSLMLHFYEQFDPEECNIKFIGLNRYAHAEALKNAKDKKGLRFCANDEADVSRRDHMTKYNKKLLTLMWQIRGLNIFHWWNNPSGDMLDKPLVEERLKGLIYIDDKSEDRPRIYYYFAKKALLEIWDKEKSLKHSVLKNYKNLAFYKGAFSKYTGKLLEPYLLEKNKKMGVAIEEFAQFMGDERAKVQPEEITQEEPEEIKQQEQQKKEIQILANRDYYDVTDLAGIFGYTKKSFQHLFYTRISKHLIKDVHYVKTIGRNGRWRLFQSAIPKIKSIIENNDTNDNKNHYQQEMFNNLNPIKQTDVVNT